MHAFRIWVRKCCIGSSLLLRSASRYRLFSLRFYIWSLRDCKQRDFLTIFIICYFWILNDLFKSMIVFSCHKKSRIDCVKCVFEPSWAPTTENEGSFIRNSQQYYGIDIKRTTVSLTYCQCWCDRLVNGTESKVLRFDPVTGSSAGQVQRWVITLRLMQQELTPPPHDNNNNRPDDDIWSNFVALRCID